MTRTMLDVRIGEETFPARLEEALAPVTCARFLAVLPLRDQIVHVRWSGEACWIPMGDARYDLPWENATSHPAPGQFIFYPGGPSETEILLAYGAVAFSSKVGQLAGNHFLTILDRVDRIAAIGREVLRQGERDIVFSLRA